MFISGGVVNVTNSVVSGNSAVSVCCRDCIERASQIETEKDPSNTFLSFVSWLLRDVLGWWIFYRGCCRECNE